MRRTTQPVDGAVWVALERDAINAVESRRRLRSKCAVKKMEGVEEEDSEEEKAQEMKQRITDLIEEEGRRIFEDEADIAEEEMKILQRLKKMIAPEEEEEVLQTRIVSPKEVSANWEEWLESVKEEVDSLIEDKEAFRRVPPEEVKQMLKEAEQTGKKIETIPSKVIFTRKPGKSGGKKKTRWVICGNFEEKKEGEENYSGGADATAFRVIIWCACREGWVGVVLDVKTAFLNADMDEDQDVTILIVPPSIFVEKRFLPRDTMYLPLKAVYGLRRSPKLWGTHRDNTIRSLRIQVTRGKKMMKMKCLQMDTDPLKKEWNHLTIPPYRMDR